MKNFVHRAKTYLLLHLIYYHERPPRRSENIAFFALSDYKECLIFMININVSLAELVELVDFLYKADMVRFIQLQDTMFVFLTERACRFVLKEHDGFMECSKYG